MHSIRIFTHGTKFSGPDPLMTVEGFEQVRALRQYLYPNPSLVVSGTGQRHICVAEALGLVPDEYSYLAGDPDSGEMVGKEFMVFLPGGTIIPQKKHFSLKDSVTAIMPFLQRLPDRTVLCSGRPLGFIFKYAGLYDGDFQSAAVYRVNIYSDGINVKKIHAIGDVDPTLKA